MAAASPAKRHISALRSALTAKSLPCSTGVFPVEERDLSLFFCEQGGDQAYRLNFGSASEDEVRRLADACDVATFGLNQEHVLDETYRKAGKLDVGSFATKFDPVHSGLISTLREVLLEGHGAAKSIRAELYKLNVYSPGSFFKTHKDTPRGDTMFASLVVVFPTAHQGGSLLFRHGELDYRFDSATLLAQACGPSIAFAAFYSDVEHEVALVESGYRVTVTYNLYFDDLPTLPIAPFIGSYEAVLKTAFRELLSDPEFCREGGLLGFGLRHEYAIQGRSPPALVRLEDHLKGSDAALMKVCKDLALKSSLKILYRQEDPEGYRLCDFRLYEGEFLGEGLSFELNELHVPWVSSPLLGLEGDDAEVVGKRKYRGQAPQRKGLDVLWATPIIPAGVSEDATPYLAYGNEPWMEYAYSTVCLIVEIDKYEGRTASNT